MTLKKDLNIYEKLKKNGKLSHEKEQGILFELSLQGEHEVHECPLDKNLSIGKLLDYMSLVKKNGIYRLNDYNYLQEMGHSQPNGMQALQTIDDLLARDEQRAQDGFPKKIKIGKIVKPGRGKKGKVIVVPTTQEEKFYHDDNFTPPQEGGQGEGGQGEGEEGEVIGEQPIDGQEGEGEEGDQGPGQGEGGDHGIGSDAYDLGKILTKQFELPNIQQKKKKRAVTKYKYDLTDRNRYGQLLDKKATLRKIVKTNISLGNIPDPSNIDTQKFMVAPRDRVMRALSKEKEYESPAVVFFIRDYSGSMMGKPTEVVVNQHILIYAWLMYQYEKIVESRFILHDTSAKEVPDFYTYYNSTVAGGTQVVSSFKLAHEIVEKENLARDYNIYVFYGGDGDDWDDGKECIEYLEKMMTYTNRIGLTIASNYGQPGATTMAQYLGSSGILEKSDLIRLVSMDANQVDEDVLIEGIKHLISA
ncbi:MAG: DUF444 family protein [Nanoarchaeota archaeon]|nr:DUF444 family protein [Nanoarchaeota archaeon]MCG2718349.1 DUF444 family protein [Nanoarchaeota archaeon]